MDSHTTYSGPGPFQMASEEVTVPHLSNILDPEMLEQRTVAIKKLAELGRAQSVARDLASMETMFGPKETWSTLTGFKLPPLTYKESLGRRIRYVLQRARTAIRHGVNRALDAIGFGCSCGRCVPDYDY